MREGTQQKVERVMREAWKDARRKRTGCEAFARYEGRLARLLYAAYRRIERLEGRVEMARGGK